MWGMLAAAAVPYVVGAFQKKPKAPGAPKPVVLPDRSEYINSILNSAWNQNTGAYMRAADIANENVNRILAKQGLAGSSIGAQVAMAQQNELASSWVEEELRRRQEAFNVVNQYDMAAAGVQQQNNNAAYQHAMAQYEDRLRRNASVAQGLGAIANVGANAYYAGQAKNLIDKRRAEDRAWMTGLFMNNQPVAAPSYVPSYGVPGYTGYSPGSYYGLNYQLPGI